MLTDYRTLAQFLVEGPGRHRSADADLHHLILEVALACEAVAHHVALGALNGHREEPAELVMIANDYFLRATQRGDRLAGMATTEFDEPYVVPSAHPRGDYLLVVDPLAGASQIDVNASVGSIFSILRAPEPGMTATTADFLQPGTAQVCAGYALYGPATVLVLTTGRGVHAFTLHPGLGEFVLTRESIRMSRHASEFTINTPNRRFREPAVRRYVGEHPTGRAGPRHGDRTTRCTSLAAETHRILTRGGVFHTPPDTEDAATPGRLWQLCEANPVAFLVEQAGGAASTGRGRALDVIPTGLHQRTRLIFGSRDQVALVERYHQQNGDRPYDSPLYGERGLFRIGTS